MSSTAKRVPRIDTAAKRTRQKTADEVIVASKPAPARTTRAKSTERSEPKSRKSSVSRSNKSNAPSRSPSRSPSRQRSRKSTSKPTLGAKVHTKKELETARSKRGASKSRRSPSATRTKSKSAERKSVDRSRSKAGIDDETIADLEQRFGSDNVNRNTYFEDDDISSASRYSLRQRATPALSSSPAKSTSSINITRRGGDNKNKCCWLSCGYLKYQKQDCCKIVIATVVLLVALAVANYFHLVDFASIKTSVTNLGSSVFSTLVTKPLGFCCDTTKAAADSLKAFFANMWTRIAS